MPCDGTTTECFNVSNDRSNCSNARTWKNAKQSERTILFLYLEKVKKSSYVDLAAGNLSERVQMAMVRKAQAAKHLMTASSYAKTRRAKVFVFFQMRHILSQESCPRRI